MTICPFMSRPVVTMEQIGEYRKADTPELFIVGCLREKCAAWGPVSPFWTTRDRDENRETGWDEVHVEPAGNEWKETLHEGKIDHGVWKMGCRRIGGEVRE